MHTIVTKSCCPSTFATKMSGAQIRPPGPWEAERPPCPVCPRREKARQRLWRTLRVLFCACCWPGNATVLQCNGVGCQNAPGAAIAFVSMHEWRLESSRARFALSANLLNEQIPNVVKTSMWCTSMHVLQAGNGDGGIQEQGQQGLVCWGKHAELDRECRGGCGKGWGSRRWGRTSRLGVYVHVWVSVGACSP